MRKIISFLIILALTFYPKSYATIFFDTDDYLLCTDIASVDTATSLSASAWVYFTVDTADEDIISKDNAQIDGFRLYRDDVGSVSGRTNTFNISVLDSADTDAVRIEGASGAAPAGQWIHVAFTFLASSSTGLRLYVNGVEDANSPVSVSNIGAINAGANELIVGDFAGTTYMSGRISDVVIEAGSIWTADEISKMAASKGKRVCLQFTPTGCWPLDDQPGGTSGDGDTFRDISGNGFNCTGNDGANNADLTMRSEEVLSYP